MWCLIYERKNHSVKGHFCPPLVNLRRMRHLFLKCFSPALVFVVLSKKGMDVLFKQNNSVLEFRNFSSQEKRHTVVAHKSTLPSPVRGSFLYPPKLIIVPAKSVQLKYIAACSISVFTRTVAYTNMMSRYNSFHGALGGENKKL